jgi:hypothetical protein
MINSESIYRIGLVGRSNAGKTSLLVALSEMREHAVVEDQSWRISYLPPVEGEEIDKGVFEKRKRGERLLNAAKESIKNIDKPPPTEEKDTTTLYRFQLATGGCKRTVELWDYAGEILAPSRLNSIESFGFQLGKRIAECDAVLILAPASDESEESKNDEDRSSQVEQAISQMDDWIKDNDALNKVRHRPYALLVTKADRVNQLHSESVEHPADAAGKVWGKIQALFGSGVTRWFALSTLPEFANSKDLISPLVWAINAADAEVIALAQRAKQRSFFGWTDKKLAVKQLNKLVCRRPPTADVEDSIHKQATESKRLLNASLQKLSYIVGAVVAVILWLFICCGDFIRTNSYKSIANDESSTAEQLKESEVFFHNYDSIIRRLSPFSLDAKEADELYKQSRGLRAKRQWERIASEVDPITKGELAEAFQIEFREKQGSPEVIAAIIEARKEAARRRYSNWVDRLKIRSERKDLTLDERSMLIDEMASMPKDLIETKEQFNDRNSILDQLRKAQYEEIRTATRRVFVEQLENLVQRKRPFEALSALKEKTESLEWPEMEATLILMRDNWKGDVESYLSRLRQEAQFENAIQTLQAAIRDFKVIPESVGLPDKAMLPQLLSQILGEWDKSEYNDFRANPSVLLANKYLSSSHSKCMSQTVESWVTWKQSESSPRSLRPQLVSITWDKDYGAWHPLIDFTVNGQRIMNKQPAGDGKRGETKEFAESNLSLEFENNSPIECEIVLWDDDWPSDDDVEGKFLGTFRFSDLILAQGKTDFLREDDEKATHTFRIRLVGMEKAPDLIEWQPCK